MRHRICIPAISIIAILLAVGCTMHACKEVDKGIESYGVGWVEFSINLSDNALAPQTGTFALSLSEVGTDFSNTWQDIANFPSYDSFAVSSYVAEACSSSHYGDIDTEDANVPVTADVENSRYVGSQLWIDNLSFAY